VSERATTPPPPIPYARIGIVAGLFGILCCVGPVVLALVGALSAAAAADLAYDLYGGYAWYFRGAGLLVGALLVVYALRKRNACDIRGVKAVKGKIALALVVALVTYAILYAVTTWLGKLA